MFEFVKNVVFILLIVSVGLSVYFSYKFRRQSDPVARGLLQANQNIAMGVMLIVLAIYPIYLMPGTNISVTIGIVFLLIGLFNLFVGIRNRSVHKHRKR